MRPNRLAAIPLAFLVGVFPTVQAAKGGNGGGGGGGGGGAAYAPLVVVDSTGKTVGQFVGYEHQGAVLVDANGIKAILRIGRRVVDSPPTFFLVRIGMLMSSTFWLQIVLVPLT